MNYLLETRNLGKCYDDFVLEGVNLRVPAGMVVGLIGENGAGKTTSLKAILGLIAPDEGEVRLFGSRVDTSGEEAAPLRERIGVVLDTCAFPSESRIIEVGRMGRVAYRTWNDETFRTLLGTFGLNERKKVKDLSRGMGMKLTLAFALAHDPSLLVLDEATAGLDPLAREEVLELLRTFMMDERHGILLSTHITTDLEKIADRIACIHQGHLVFDRPKDEVCDLPGIVRCRGAEVDELVEDMKASGEDVRVLSKPYGFDLMVPDRFAFVKRHPDILCDRMSLEDYMAFSLKGAVR